MFILGTILGFGLSQMLQSINKFRQVRRNNRLIKEQQAFNVRVAQAVALANSWETCGCHSSWEDHESYMLG